MITWWFGLVDLNEPFTEMHWDAHPIAGFSMVFSPHLCWFVAPSHNSWINIDRSMNLHRTGPAKSRVIFSNEAPHWIRPVSWRLWSGGTSFWREQEPCGPCGPWSGSRWSWLGFHCEDFEIYLVNIWIWKIHWVPFEMIYTWLLFHLEDWRTCIAWLCCGTSKCLKCRGCIHPTQKEIWRGPQKIRDYIPSGKLT